MLDSGLIDGKRDDTVSPTVMDGHFRISGAWAYNLYRLRGMAEKHVGTRSSGMHQQGDGPG